MATSFIVSKQGNQSTLGRSSGVGRCALLTARCSLGGLTWPLLTYAVYAEAEVGACGVHAWQTNARVVHAVARAAEGPYQWSDDPLPGLWRSGPDISRAADGTFLLMTMASNATAVECVDGVGNYSCPPDPVTGKLPKPGYPCAHNGLLPVKTRRLLKHNLPVIVSSRCRIWTKSIV